MPIGEFGIETYSVAQGRFVEGPVWGLLAGPVSVIDIYGKVEAAGSRATAQLLFAPAFDRGLSGHVDNVGLSAAGLRVWANLPYEDFTRMYDILERGSSAPVVRIRGRCNCNKAAGFGWNVQSLQRKAWRGTGGPQLGKLVHPHGAGR